MKLIKHIVIISVLLSSTVSGFAKEKIHISIGEYPPAFSEYVQHLGYGSHVVTEAYKLVDIEIVYKFRPWKRAYKEAAAGKYEATCCYMDSGQERKEFHFANPVSNLESVYLFHLKSFDFDWNTIEDLKGLNLSLERSFKLGPEFEKAAKEGLFDVFYVNKDEQSLKMLLKKRVQLVPLLPLSTHTLLRNNFPQGTEDLVTYHPKPLLQTPAYILFTRKEEYTKRSLHLIRLFNKGLKLLKESGKYDQIFTDALAGKYKTLKTKWNP